MRKINLYLDKSEESTKHSFKGFLGAFLYGACCVAAINLMRFIQ